MTYFGRARVLLPEGAFSETTLVVELSVGR
jgi:hypothetical protein